MEIVLRKSTGEQVRTTCESLKVLLDKGYIEVLRLDTEIVVLRVDEEGAEAVYSELIDA
jgi:hypothetical protein